VIVRVVYDNGSSHKTLLCTKSDLVGNICRRMANYSSHYRCGTSYYKSLLDKGVIHYTEELDYLINDHSSFQLYQPSNEPQNAKWLFPVNALGDYSVNKRFHFAHSCESLQLDLFELEFKSRIRPLKYSCVLMGNASVTRTILIDDNWSVKQILQAVLTQMYPQIPEGENYCLAYSLQKDGKRGLCALRTDQALHQQQYADAQVLVLAREQELWC